MGDAILTLNAGSSSLKFALYRLDGLAEIAVGKADNVGHDDCRIAMRAATGQTESIAAPRADQTTVLNQALTWMQAAAGDAAIVACSHRVVHGGPDLSRPIRLDGGALERLERLNHLAPLHQPHNLAGVRAAMAALPDAAQIACFDTAFHRGHPPTAEVYALPRAVTEAGVRRYGFHGLSYEFIAERLRATDPALYASSVIVAHLGSGASLCAISGGQSVDSTMGFTALDGLPMATRTGQLDPGVVLHLLRQGRSIDDVEDMLYRESGLKGLSGVSGDMRALLASEAPEAAFAVDYFCYRVAREIGALAVSLGQLDGIVFTAGIGENQPEIRENVAARLRTLGVAVDSAANAAGASRFDSPASAVKLLRIPTDEESMLARHGAALLRP